VLHPRGDGNPGIPPGEFIDNALDLGIRRGVVGNDNLQVTVALLADAGQGTAQSIRSIVGGNADADERLLETVWMDHLCICSSTLSRDLKA